MGLEVGGVCVCVCVCACVWEVMCACVISVVRVPMTKCPNQDRGDYKSGWQLDWEYEQNKYGKEGDAKSCDGHMIHDNVT